MSLCFAIVLTGNATADNKALFKAYRFPLSLMVLWILYQIIQILPLPLPGLDGWATISINPSDSIQGIALNVSLVSLMLSSMMLATSSDRLKKILLVIVLTGSANAIYALFVYLSVENVSFFVLPEPFKSDKLYHHVTRGTFVNHNHFFDFMAITLTYLVAIYESTRPSITATSQSKWIILIDSFYSERTVYLVLTLLIFTALIMSHSRGGYLAMLAAWLLVTVVLFHAKRTSCPPQNTLNRKVNHTLKLILIILVAMVTITSTSKNYQQPYAVKEFNLHSNSPIFRSSLKLINAHPITGSGTNTYDQAHTPYIQHYFPKTTLHWSHAHNGYLELIAEQGIIGFLLLGGAIVFLTIRFFQHVFVQPVSIARNCLIANALTTMTLLIHAIAEYNFQVPALSAYFFISLGLGMAASQLGGPTVVCNKTCHFGQIGLLFMSLVLTLCTVYLFKMVLKMDFFHGYSLGVLAWF